MFEWLHIGTYNGRNHRTFMTTKIGVFCMPNLIIGEVDASCIELHLMEYDIRVALSHLVDLWWSSSACRTWLGFYVNDRRRPCSCPRYSGLIFWLTWRSVNVSRSLRTGGPEIESQTYFVIISHPILRVKTSKGCKGGQCQGRVFEIISKYPGRTARLPSDTTWRTVPTDARF
jgi:hypothetical protein